MLGFDGWVNKGGCENMTIDEKYSLPFGWSIFLNHIGFDHVYGFSQGKLVVMIQAESLNVLV